MAAALKKVLREAYSKMQGNRLGGFLTFRDLSHPSLNNGEVIDTLTSSTNLFIFVFSPVTQALVAWSDNSRAVLGVNDFEIARDGNVFFRCVHGDDRFQLLNDAELAFKQKSSLRLVYRWLRPDTQELCWLLCRAEPIERDEGLVYEGILTDITAEIGHLGGDLQPSSAIFDALQTVAIILDSDARVLYRYIPKELQDFHFGDESFLQSALQPGRIFLDGFSSSAAGHQIHTMLTEVINGQKGRGIERVLWNGRLIGVNARALSSASAHRRTLVYTQDESKAVELETDRTRVYQSETFTRLAGGIFHRVNSALQVIVGHAAAIQHHPTNQAVVRKSSDAIVALVQQTSDLTHQLLEFKDAVLDASAPIDLNSAIMTALNRVRPLLKSGVLFSLNLGTVAPVQTNFAALVDALDSLLRAAPLLFDTGSEFSLQSNSVEVTEPTNGGVGVGYYCKLVLTRNLASNGKMPAELFAPKAAPKRIATNSDEDRTLANLLKPTIAIFARCGGSVKEEFTNSGLPTVAIYFSTQPLQKTVRTYNVMSPRILIVDDDALVVKTIASFLKNSGYETVTAETRQDAVTKLKTHQSSLKLIILDALLSTGNTRSLLRQLHRIVPTIPIVGFSGASASELEALLDAGAVQVLRKPVNPHTLLSLVRELIEGQKAA